MGHLWHQWLSAMLLGNNFTYSQIDKMHFYKTNQDQIAIITIYIDDPGLFTRNLLDSLWKFWARWRRFLASKLILIKLPEPLHCHKELISIWCHTNSMYSMPTQLLHKSQRISNSYQGIQMMKNHQMCLLLNMLGPLCVLLWDHDLILYLQSSSWVNLIKNLPRLTRQQSSKFYIILKAHINSVQFYHSSNPASLSTFVNANFGNLPDAKSISNCFNLCQRCYCM